MSVTVSASHQDKTDSQTDFGVDLFKFIGSCSPWNNWRVRVLKIPMEICWKSSPKSKFRQILNSIIVIWDGDDTSTYWLRSCEIVVLIRYQRRQSHTFSLGNRPTDNYCPWCVSYVGIEPNYLEVKKNIASSKWGELVVVCFHFSLTIPLVRYNFTK